MKNKSAFAHLALVVIIAVAVGLLLLVLISKNKVSLPGAKKEPTVQVKSEYKNPFNKDTQYVNPFDQYKSPFINAQ